MPGRALADLQDVGLCEKVVLPGFYWAYRAGSSKRVSGTGPLSQDLNAVRDPEAKTRSVMLSTFQQVSAMK